MRNSIKLEIKNAQAQELNSFNKLESLERTRNLAQRVFDVSQIKYKEGVGSSLELNDAETQLKQAESNYLSGVFELHSISWLLELPNTVKWQFRIKTGQWSKQASHFGSDCLTNDPTRQNHQW